MELLYCTYVRTPLTLPYLGYLVHALCRSASIAYLSPRAPAGCPPRTSYVSSTHTNFTSNTNPASTLCPARLRPKHQPYCYLSSSSSHAYRITRRCYRPFPSLWISFYCKRHWCWLLVAGHIGSLTSLISTPRISAFLGIIEVFFPILGYPHFRIFGLAILPARNTRYVRLSPTAIWLYICRHRSRSVF
jgi:hypothetical protein